MSACFRKLAAASLLLAVGACGMDMDEAPGTTPIAPVSLPAVFVVNGGSSSISVLSASDGSVVGTIEMSHASYPHHIAVSPDGTRLALAVPGMDLSSGHGSVDDGSAGQHGGMAAVLLLDPSTGKTLAARKLPAMNHNAAFSPDGTEVWTSQMMGHEPGSVLVLDGATLATKNTISVGQMPAEVTFSHDGLRAFVANGMSSSVTVIDVASKTVVKTLSVCEGPVGAWTGMDNMMYTDCETGQALAVIDAGSLAAPKPIPLGFMPGMAATRPSQAGELWVTDSDGGRVVFFSASTGEKSGEAATGSGAHGIAFSDDGSRAFVTNQAAGSVSVIDCATKAVAAPTVVGDKPNGLVLVAPPRGHLLR